MNKEVTSGKPGRAQLPQTATPKTNAAKKQPSATNKVEIKPASTQPVRVQNAAIPLEESSPEFASWRSTRQITNELPVSEKSLYNWRRAGILPYGLIGNKILYNRTLIEKMLKSRWNLGLLLVNVFLNIFPMG